MTAPRRVLVDLIVEEVSLVSAPANPEARVTLFKSKELAMAKKKAAEEPVAVEAPVVEDPAPVQKTEEVPSEAVEAPAEQNVEMPAEKAEEPVEAPAEEPEVPPAPAEEVSVEKRLQDEIATLRKEREDFEKKLTETIRVSKVKERERKIEDVWKALPVKASDLAEALTKLDEAVPEVAKEIDALLAKCAEIIGASEVLKVAAAAATVPTTVAGRVDALVAKKIAENPRMSKAKAEVMVYAENPGLYDEYMREQKDRAEAA